MIRLTGKGGSQTIVTGVEIDTGDTLDGQAIYKKVINIAVLPNNGTISTAHGLSDLGQPLGFELVGHNGSSWLPIAYSTTGAGTTHTRMNARYRHKHYNYTEFECLE